MQILAYTLHQFVSNCLSDPAANFRFLRSRYRHDDNDRGYATVMLMMMIIININITTIIIILMAIKSAQTTEEMTFGKSHENGFH